MVRLDVAFLGWHIVLLSIPDIVGCRRKEVRILMYDCVKPFDGSNYVYLLCVLIGGEVGP